MSGHADDWPRVKEIFAAALNLPPEARTSYLAATCGGDDQLRAQVKGLLDSHERARSFLETSQEPPSDLQSPRRHLEGQRIGAYEVVARLGAGGMGEVYRARDLRLGRDVAIKILPEVFTRDPERLARFEREARVLAALTHPNIGAIYGVEDPAPGSGPLTTAALLLELIEGDTLAERIARSTRDSGFGRQRGLPMAEAVKIAAQIADALEAAHDKGIVHRDLKPANIKITPAGVVKVLDFGLAKALDDDMTSPDLSHSPTMMSDGTRAGMILGTAAYMSPEQARGHVVDKRTDIWAFACVLYEMLAGHAVFPGATVSDTIAAILEREPEWSALPSATPVGVRHLLRRCLEKDARQRLRDIGEARIELLSTVKVLEQVRPNEGRRAVRIPPRFAMGGAAAVVLAGLAIAMTLGYSAWTTFGSRAPEPGSVPVRRFVFQPPANAPLLASFLFGLSPDGTRLVYTARVGAGSQLQMRRLDQLEVEPLAGFEGAIGPFFSPDGQSIAFYSDGRIRRAPATGGAPVTIAEVPRGIIGASWGPDGTILFGGIASPLRRVPADGGIPVPVMELSEAAGEIDHHTPFYLPDGTAFLFGVHAGRELFRVAARSLVTGEQRILVQDGFAPRYAASGHLVFARGSTLLATPFDSERLAIMGPEVALIENLATVLDSGLASYSISKDGTLAFVPAPSLAGRTLVWVDRTGRVEPAAMPPQAYSFPSLSPDGRRLAVQVADGRRSDIWIHRFADGAATRLAVEGLNSRPGWTPDGQQVTFSTRRGEERFLLTQTVDGTSSGETLAKSRRTDLWAGSWTPDGQALAFVDAPPTDISDINLLRRSGGTVEPLIAGPATQRGPSFSPDGRWLAYESDESGRFEVYLRPFPASGVPRQISTNGGGLARWSSDGREVFFILARRFYSVPIRTAPTLEVGAPRLLFELPFGPTGGGVGPPPWDVTPDGQRFIFIKPGDDELAPRPIYIVENWFEELKRRVRPGPVTGAPAP